MIPKYLVQHKFKKIIALYCKIRKIEKKDNLKHGKITKMILLINKNIYYKINNSNKIYKQI